ncbi:hypothetical protein CVT26_007816 [Gymnopilus dilepis]|uniref:Uncharacterized protein n=1 Tax=Gymnopilus dilepis TaxID=231916 RepID=A0A409W7S8_9AGAR|nr:hypothetical protein CVT26_007816 [Gymnopilus dilepis]
MTAKLRLMCASSDLIWPVGSFIYRHVHVSGLTARSMALTIVTSTTINYGDFIVSLHFTGRTLADIHLTYPLFAEALLHMNNLRVLDLTIPSNHTGYLVSLFKRKGLIRTSTSQFACISDMLSGDNAATRKTLSVLRSLTFDADPSIICLASNRRLANVDVRKEVNITGLATIMDSIEWNALETLSMAVTISVTSELIIVLHLVGDACKNLTRMDIRTGTFNALVSTLIYLKVFTI